MACTRMCTHNVQVWWSSSASVVETTAGMYKIGSLDMRPTARYVFRSWCSCAEAMSTHMERRRADSSTGPVAVGSLRLMADMVIGGGMGAETFGNVDDLISIQKK